MAAKQILRNHTDVPDWYIDQLASSDTFYTSLTHNGRYVASKHVIGRRADHQEVWRPEETDESVVFHRQETTAEALNHLVFRRPSGLTAAEASDLLGRGRAPPRADHCLSDRVTPGKQARPHYS